VLHVTGLGWIATTIGTIIWLDGSRMLEALILPESSILIYKLKCNGQN
jgi:hypothetical protein